MNSEPQTTDNASRQAPIHVLSLGAGVQSSTMALMAAHGEITPMPVAAIFADTLSEPQSVYDWLDWIETKLPFPVHRLIPKYAGEKRSGLTNAITSLRTKRDGSGTWVYSGIPTYNTNPDGSLGHVQRQCTSEFKVKPLEKKQRKIAKIKRGQKTVGVVSWIGISLDEAHRMKPSKNAWALNRWPLIEMRMRRGDCLRWMNQHGYPEPPRSACVYCPYHSDAEWRRLRDKEPEAFYEAVRVDKEYRRLKALSGQKGVPYIHASRKPLDEVDFSTEEDRGQQPLFGNECEGMCGV